MTKRNGTGLSYCEITIDGEIRTIHWSEDEPVDLGDFAVGKKISDRYVLRAELGKGGMGCVFLAHDTTLDRSVALKVELRRRSSGSDLDLAREARLGALLTHQGIASVFDFGTHDERPFTIFEYVKGKSLRQVMEERKHWSVEDVLAVIKPLAGSLDFAHAEGVIHSDLKPENICLTPSGRPKILDFGIARNLKSDADAIAFRGTAAYASPEQAACRPADGRSDQYTLGLIAFELFASQRPFVDDNVLSQLFSHEYDMPPHLHELRPDIPRSVAEAVMRTLEKLPSDRFATCREFVQSFSEELWPEFAYGPEKPSSLVATTEIHISETSSESLVARKLANAFESIGFATWYYQRDALPGIPLARQVDDSLQNSRAALLLISRTALASEDFSEEVMSAHRLGRLCLPVLVDMSLEEFESHQPIWRPALGTAAVTELERDAVHVTAERIMAAVTKLGIKPSRPPSQSASSARSSSAQIWATDANQIDIGELDRIVFRNDIIDEFLKRRNKYFVSATKGLGKTLLLTFKRHLMSQQRSKQRDGDESFCLIPQGRPFLDFMSEMKSLSARHERPLSDLSTCKRLWGAALRISILSNFSSLLHDDQQFELAPFPTRLQRWLKGARVEPTVVFKELTGLPISDFNRLIDKTENFLDEQIRQVHSATMVFIDKVDQAVRRLSRDAWINVQAGLIEAAWDLMSANSHIRVFASIRQEAFANYESDVKSNLFGATTILRYTDDELRKLLDRLAGCYEGTTSFKNFIGVNVIKHARRPFPEDSFGFLRRYTIGRPRDFVAIASELSSTHSLDEHRYCDVVRKTSSMGLVANVFEETQIFLDCLHDKSNRLNFLGQLPANIMTRAEAIAASARFNGLPEDNLGHFDEESPEIFHPFRDLFLTGLLGVVKRNDQDIEAQRFRQPDDVLNDTSRDLPNSTHYLIHPALSEYIQEHRQSSDFHIFQHILVGENAPWRTFDPIICQVEREAAKIGNKSLRDNVHVLLAMAKIVLLSAKPKNLRIEFESSADWYRTQEKLLAAGHDEVILWMEELMK